MQLFLALLSLNMKSAMAMRATFLIRLSFTTVNNGFNLIIWLLFFKAVPTVHGWTIWHLLMAYGLCWFAWGFTSYFTYGFRMLARMIEFGELDHFLLQPRPLLLMLALNNGEINGLPDMVLALILTTVAAIKLHVLWHLVIFGLVCSTVTFTSFTLLIGSLSFWLHDMHDWIMELQYLSFIFATKPSSAFSGWIKVLMFSLLPMGFVSFLPVQIMRLQNPWLIAAQITGSLIIMALSLFIFRLGLKHYESGNRFGVRI